MTNANFEGLVAPHQAAAVPDGYAGLNWHGIGVLGFKKLDNLYPLDNGYHETIDRRAVAFTQANNHVTWSKIGGAGHTFSLHSGTFAAAWDTGEKVTFYAIKNGVAVAHKTVILDQNASEIHFGVKFAHVDSVVIFGRHGTDANPADDADGGFGANLAMDNIKFDLDTGAAPPHVEHMLDATTAHDFAYDHAWPLA